MNWIEALEALGNGKLLKLPEWTGFWYVNKDKELNVFTADGKISTDPHIAKYMDRLDWEMTDGLRDIGGMIKALKSIDSIVDFTVRDGSEGKFTYYEGKEPSIRVEYIGKNPIDWIPTQEELLAEDYVVWDNDMLGR